jgi:hypothetical protein
LTFRSPATTEPPDGPQACGCGAEERLAVVGLVHNDDLAGLGAAEVKEDEHPRQDEERLASGREEGAGDPAVRVRDLAERGEVALDSGQVLEVRGRRHEQRIDLELLEPCGEAVEARRQLGGKTRIHAAEATTDAPSEPGCSPRSPSSARTPPWPVPASARGKFLAAVGL